MPKKRDLYADEADLLEYEAEWDAANNARARAIYGRGMTPSELRAVWSAHGVSGLSFSSFSRRLARGWKLKDAALTPVRRPKGGDA